MLIDAHTHIGFGGAIKASVDDLLASMHLNQIDKALVFSGRLNDCLSDRLIETIKPHKGKLYGVGYAGPGDGHIANQLEFIEENFKNGNLVALKFYPGYEYFYPADICIRPALELCVQYNKPAIFHSGSCFVHEGICAKVKYAHPLAIDDLAAEMPKLKIIMAHMGNPFIIEGAEVCYSKKNVYADCSGYVTGSFTTDQIDRFCDHVRYFLSYVENPEKLLFGTDWPICNQKSYLNAFDQAIKGKATLWALATERMPQELFGL